MSDTVVLDRVSIANRPFAAYGTTVDVLLAKEDEVLVEGPAGTGKSRGILEKVHICMEKYPESRALFVRKTRSSMSESVLHTWENHVIPPGHPILSSNVQRQYRHSYQYPNRSEVVVAGMDKPDKILSTEFDLIYVQEGTELEEHELETLTTRNRNFRMPYQQVIVDCNPSYPKHWLNLRAIRGQMRRIKSVFQDNPRFWDHVKGEWTDEGRNYVLGKLAKLSGVRKDRFYRGKWAQAEGMIYDEWNEGIHRIDRFRVPDDWTSFWVVDFGFVHPFCWHRWVKEPGKKGALIRTHEIYKTGVLVEDHAARILKITEGMRTPSVILCDHDAEDRATLERHLGMKTRPAQKDVLGGIQVVKELLTWDSRDDQKPQMYFMRDAILEEDIDRSLFDNRLAWCTEDEFDSYVWDTKRGQHRGEAPVKKDDHGLDNTRYIAVHCHGGVVRRSVKVT